MPMTGPTTGRARPPAASRDPATRLLVGLLLAAVAIFGGCSPERFFSGSTWRAVAFQLPELGILALAMMIPLVSGGLNLAIIATANLCGLVMAAILTQLLGPASSPAMIAGVIALALPAGLGAALLVGLLNGALVAGLRLHPILVTLGTMILVNGLSVAATHGGVIGGFPPAILYLGNGTILGVPVSLLLFGACASGVGLLLARTPFGVRVRLTGSNEPATRFSGVNTTRVLIGVYLASSVLCWVAALVMIARFNSARAGYAESYLLITILAAVLGGVDPFGGFGRVRGVILSLLLLQVIATGFNLLGFSPRLTEAIWGATMVFALVLARLRLHWVNRPEPAAPPGPPSAPGKAVE
jgi:simple sugar transport system permease protein